MGKSIEITTDMQHDSTRDHNRWFGYYATINIDKKHSINLTNDMDAKPETSTDTCWQFYIHTKGGYKFRIKGIDGVLDKEKVDSLSSMKTIFDRNKLTLGFQPPKLENGRYDDEMALEYMHAICGCFDIKKHIFDMEKAMNISKQYDKTARELDSARKNKECMEKVKTNIEEKVQVESEDKGL